MLFELNYFTREIVIETISLGIIVMISHQNYLTKSAIGFLWAK